MLTIPERLASLDRAHAAGAIIREAWDEGAEFACLLSWYSPEARRHAHGDRARGRRKTGGIACIVVICAFAFSKTGGNSNGQKANPVRDQGPHR